MKDPTDESAIALIVAFRASPELVNAIDATAASEGISRSDVARRACLRDLRAKKSALETVATSDAERRP